MWGRQKDNQASILNRRQQVIFLIAITMLVITYAYNDTVFLVRHGLNVWGSIFEGEGLFSFYTYNHMQTLKCQDLGLLACDAMYDFPIYAIMAIWHLPLYLLQRLTGFDMATTWFGILYGKLLFILFLFIGAAIIRKICLLIDLPEYKADWAVVLYLTSLITFNGVYIVGQCDSIGITFILLGLFYYLKKNRKYFLIFFALAVSMKLFALLVFGVLLLYIEKRIVYLIRDTVSVCSITFLSRILFPNSMAGSTPKGEFESNMIKGVLSNRLPLAYGIIPASFFIICSIFVYCYLTRRSNEHKVIVSCFAIMFCFFISFSSTPYWYMYILPFFSICLVMIKRYELEAVVLSAIGDISLTGALYLIDYWCYDVNMVDKTVIGKLLGAANYSDMDFSFKRLAGWEWSKTIAGLLTTIFIVTFGAILILSILCVSNHKENTEKTTWGNAMVIKIYLNIAVAYIPIIVYIINRAIPYIYNNR